MGKLWRFFEVLEHLMGHKLEHVIDNLAVNDVHLVDELNEVFNFSAVQEALPLGSGHVFPVLDGESFKEVIHVTEDVCNVVDTLDVHSVEEHSLEVRRGNSDESCVPFGLSESVNITHIEPVKELASHALIKDLPYGKDLVSRHVIEDSLEALAVKEYDVGLPFCDSGLFPGCVGKTCEVVEKLSFSHSFKDALNVMEVVEFVKNEFELAWCFLFKHLLDLLRSELSHLVVVERVNEVLEFRVILLTKEIVNDVVNFGIFEELELNQVVPIIVVEASPVVEVLHVLGHLGPNIVKVEVVRDVNILFRRHTLLLEDKPVVVISKAESNCDSGALLINGLLNGLRDLRGGL